MHSGNGHCEVVTMSDSSGDQGMVFSRQINCGETEVINLLPQTGEIE